MNPAEIAAIVTLLATPWPKSTLGKTRRATQDAEARAALRALGLDDKGNRLPVVGGK